MKFATAADGSPDGKLLVVSRDLTHAAPAADIVRNLLLALERWDEVEEDLRHFAERVDAGTAPDLAELHSYKLSAPLPRTWQWLDGSAFRSHVQLTTMAFGVPDVWSDKPLMYQGMSHRFLSADGVVSFPSADDQIDFEGEFGVIIGPLPMGASTEQCAGAIRLITQINDWSLRLYSREEAMRGFGWIHAKPACSMAPVVVTPDELGDAWRSFRCDLQLKVWRNDESFGSVDGIEMAFGFDELIAHGAYSRELPAGTIIGSGTVSNSAYREVGSSCIIERRGIAMIDTGAAVPPFLNDGEWVTMRAVDAQGRAPFGGMRTQVRVTEKAL